MRDEGEEMMLDRDKRADELSSPQLPGGTASGRMRKEEQIERTLAGF